MKKTFMLLMAALTFAVNIQAQDIIDIRFNGTSATVDIPATITDVTQYVTGANVTLTSSTATTEYIYRVSGQSSDGSLIINGDYKLTLQLAGITLTNAHGGAAIDVECGKRVAVELEEGTVNTLCDSPMGTQKAALYFKGHPEFSGAGTLTVTGKLKHAISAKEYLELKKSVGTINVLGAVSDGIHCGRGKADPEKNYFLMKGGAVNIFACGADAVDADDYGSIRIEGGSLSVNVGDGVTGLDADSVLAVSGGQVTIAVTGNDANGMKCGYRADFSGGRIDVLVKGNGSKGMKAKRATVDEAATVVGGGFVNISGGVIDIKTLGDHFFDAAKNDTTKCMPMSIDADMTMTGGEVLLTAMGTDAITHNVKGQLTLQGGTFVPQRYRWKFDATAYPYSMTCYAVIEGATPSDYTLATFCGDECRGLALPLSVEGSNIYMVRVWSTKTAGETITFRCNQEATGKEQSLQGTVAFAADAAVGTPSSPFVLKFNNASAIRELPSALSADGCVFNLQGRRVDNRMGLKAGIYIINHRKMVVR